MINLEHDETILEENLGKVVIRACRDNIVRQTGSILVKNSKIDIAPYLRNIPLYLIEDVKIILLDTCRSRD